MYMHIFFIVLSKTCYYNISYNEFTCDKVMSPLILTNADQTQIYGRGHLTNYQARLSVANEIQQLVKNKTRGIQFGAFRTFLVNKTFFFNKLHILHVNGCFGSKVWFLFKLFNSSIMHINILSILKFNFNICFQFDFKVFACWHWTIGKKQIVLSHVSTGYMCTKF